VLTLDQVIDGIVGLIDGTYTIEVQALDNFGNANPDPVAYTWTVDTVAPVTTITNGPASNDYTPTFEFVADEETVIFTYSLDGGAFVPGKSGVPLPALPDGSHTFAVKATDAAGNAGDSVSYSWEIDTTPLPAPSVSLAHDTGLPGDNVTFDPELVVVNENGATVEFSADGDAWGPDYSATEGANTVLVRQIDLAGNRSPVASLTFTLDTIEPAALGIALLNDSGSSQADLITNDGSLNVSGQEPNARVEYSADGVAWTDQFAPQEGANTVSARQTDVAGNRSPVASLSVTLDTTPPQLNPTFSSPPPFVVGAQGITLSPNATDASGIASQSAGTVDTSTVGQKSVICSATDVAGNSASVSISYAVIPNPVSAYHLTSILPAYVIPKQFTTIPVLFQLRDANNRLVSDQTAAKLLPGITITFDGVPVGKVQYHKALNLFSATLKIGKQVKGLHELAIHLTVNGSEVATLKIPVKIV
jgi:hypothetical protein